MTSRQRKNNSWKGTYDKNNRDEYEPEGNSD